MKLTPWITSLPKALALGGACALLAGAGSAATAQGYGGSQDRHYDRATMSRDRWDTRHDSRNTEAERTRLERLHRVYQRDARTGHYGAAERAHLHAQAIRSDLRETHGDRRWAHQDMNRDMHQGMDRDMHQGMDRDRRDRGY